MEHHNDFFVVALAAFCVASALAFMRLGPRRGMVAALLGGTLFLPAFDATEGVPVFRTKTMFVAGVVLLVSLALDTRGWRRLRLSAFDLPALLLCAAPFLAAIANDLGPYEGASGVLSTSLTFGAPYLLGRLYLGDREGLADLAGGLVLAGLAYVPFCLWEIRMSPQLHRLVYGFAQTTMFAQNVRLGGYRPSVFMNHGLMVALFMASATLVAYWLWRTGARRALAGLPMGAIAAVLGVTTLLCKSTGAAALLLAGLAVLEGTRLLKRPALILLLLAVPPIYCAARLGGWDGEALVTAATGAAGGERAQSVEFRLRNERELVARALERPWLGWGRFGRSRIREETGRDLSITDSLWVITLGEGGLASLISLWLLLAMPVVLLVRAAPARHWSERGVASAAALAMVALLSLVDDLLNTMATPAVLLVSGALVTLYLAARAARQPVAVRPVVFGATGGRHAA
jgi:hypothetical protein